MFNRILMELYDEYEKNKNFDAVKEFAEKTFPNDGTDKLFIGCVVILFDRAKAGFKPRYDCSREALESIVLSAKEKVGSSNLLAFYLDRVNTEKGINKYLDDVINDPNLEHYADVVLDYLAVFRPKFVSTVKEHNSYEKYLQSVSEKEES